MSTTPEEIHGNQATEPVIDEVLEALDRSLTKLKRRTRDVLNLGRERDALIVAINDGSTPPIGDSVTTIDAVDSPAIHGESVASELEGTAEAAPVDPEPTNVADVAAEEIAEVEEISEAIVEDEPIAPEPEDDADYIVDEVETEQENEAPSFDPGELTPLENPEPNLSWVAENDVELRDEADTEDVEADTPVNAVVESAPTSAPSWETTVAAEPHAQDTTDHDASPEWLDPEDDSFFETAASGSDQVTPILEVDLDDAEPEWSSADPSISELGDPVDEFGLPTVDVLATDAEDAEPIATADPSASPFASKFEDHIEELGGSLPASPFDLDNPPEPESYRPRAFQADEPDSVAAKDLLPAAAETDSLDSSPANGYIEDSPPWNTSAASPEAEPQEDVTTGSRLRDLVAQAQQAESERTAEAMSDFDLIRDEPAVSRYDKNSAKLPRSGITSEELSSSVANLRSSLTTEKKGSPASRSDDSAPERIDRKAEKRAAKEAAKAAKAEAKRQRKQK